MDQRHDNTVQAMMICSYVLVGLARTVYISYMMVYLVIFLPKIPYIYGSGHPMYLCMCVRACVHVSMCVLTPSCDSLRVCVPAYYALHALRVYMCVHVCVCVCVRVCVRLSVYMRAQV
jgi:hypothetical protein